MARQDRRGEMGQRVPAKICRNVAYLQLAGGVSNNSMIGRVAFQIRFDSLSDRSVLQKELGARDSGIGEKEEQVAPRLRTARVEFERLPRTTNRIVHVSDREIAVSQTDAEAHVRRVDVDRVGQ